MSYWFKKLSEGGKKMRKLSACLFNPTFYLREYTIYVHALVVNETSASYVYICTIKVHFMFYLSTFIYYAHICMYIFIACTILLKFLIFGPGVSGGRSVLVFCCGGWLWDALIDDWVSRRVHRCSSRGIKTSWGWTALSVKAQIDVSIPKHRKPSLMNLFVHQTSSSRKKRTNGCRIKDT